MEQKPDTQALFVIETLQFGSADDTIAAGGGCSNCNCNSNSNGSSEELLA
jgi:hypothetical protein